MKQQHISNVCRDCIHFNSERLPAKDDVCSSLGVKAYQKAPRCFQAHPIHFVRAKVSLPSLGKELRHLNHSQMITLANQLANAAELLNHGLRFGQPVVFNMASQAYVENYYRGYVVGCRTVSTKQGKEELIFVSSHLDFDEDDEGTYENRCLLSLRSDSLMSLSEWKTLHEELVAQGRLEQPVTKGQGKQTYAQWVRAGKPEVETHYEAKYTPPTLDDLASIDTYWDDLEVNESVRRVPKKDLVDMLENPNKVESGKPVIEYETYVDDDGNTVRVMTSRSNYREEKIKFFEDMVVRS